MALSINIGTLNASSYSSSLDSASEHFILSVSKNDVAQAGKSLHDLDQTVNRLSILRDLLRSGFDFTQPDGQAMLNQLDEALIRVDQATQMYRQLLIQLKTIP